MTTKGVSRHWQKPQRVEGEEVRTSQLRTTALRVRGASAWKGRQRRWGERETRCPVQASMSRPTQSLRTEIASGKSAGTWITQRLDALPEMAENRLFSGKQQKGRDGDQTRGEESLCLWAGYVKPGRAPQTSEFLGKCFSCGWVYEKERVRAVAIIRVEASYHFKWCWSDTEIECPGMWNMGKEEEERNTACCLLRACSHLKTQEKVIQFGEPMCVLEMLVQSTSCLQRRIATGILEGLTGAGYLSISIY